MESPGTAHLAPKWGGEASVRRRLPDGVRIWPRRRRPRAKRGARFRAGAQPPPAYPGVRLALGGRAGLRFRGAATAPGSADCPLAASPAAGASRDLGGNSREIRHRHAAARPRDLRELLLRSRLGRRGSDERGALPPRADDLRGPGARGGADALRDGQGQGPRDPARPLADEFARRFTEASSAIRVGDPHDDATEMGTVISEDAARQLEMLANATIKSGAALLFGDRRQHAQ